MECSPDKAHGFVPEMFNSISNYYDLLNHLFSLGIDRIWRKRLLSKICNRHFIKILDLACGTGDLSIELYKKGFVVTGVDPAEHMSRRAMRKIDKISVKYPKNILPEFITGTAEALSLPDSSFDAVTIAFGIRNFQNRELALREIYRVLRPGGMLVIVELAMPRNKLLGALFNFYLSCFMPLAGRLVSGNKYAYRYLSESIKFFPHYEPFIGEISKEGFDNIECHSMSGGIALLYLAEK